VVIAVAAMKVRAPETRGLTRHDQWTHHDGFCGQSDVQVWRAWCCDEMSAGVMDDVGVPARDEDPQRLLTGRRRAGTQPSRLERRVETRQVPMRIVGCHVHTPAFVEESVHVGRPEEAGGLGE